MKRLTWIHAEDGQTTILASVLLLFVLLPLAGVVIEGGNLFATYRKMQGAADLAAMVGAQDLPNNPGTARTDACQYVYNNGFDNCSTSGNDQSIACVPPQTQSPYNFISYGSGNSTCTGSATTYYIEVRISHSLGTIPIFNIPVTLSAHAVARSGIPGVRDYAIAVLDPTNRNQPALKLNTNNGIVAVGSVTSNATNSNSITTQGTSANLICGGTWFDSANQSYSYFANGGSNALQSNNSGTPGLAPPSCTGASNDSPAQFQSSAGQIADPYGDTASPSATNMVTNCLICTQTVGHYYKWTTSRNGGSWITLNSNSDVNVSNGDNIEIWPGVYPGGIKKTGGNLYMNPGVYTFNNDISITGSTGVICIYGAPACDVVNSGTISGTTANCSSASFHSGDSTYVSAGTWYYYCSPWGIWDDSTHAGQSAGSAPTFLDSSSGSASSIRFNGVTIYMNAGNVSMTGSSALILAAPNPCSGTGSSGSNSVDFPQGAANATYSYPSTSLPYKDGTSQTNFQVYPNSDFTLSGECLSAALEWTGELGSLQRQHLHFLILAQNSQSYVTLGGSGQENLWGIVHSFPTYTTFPNPPSGPCPNCSISISGSAGGSNGPPMLFGQVIGNDATFSGNSLVEVFNRPGGIPSGPGTSLVQ